MRWETHLLFALFIGIAGMEFGVFRGGAAFVASLFLGALLPDIDSARSQLGRRVRPLSDLIERVAGHRGVTHSLTGFAFFLAVAGLFSVAFAGDIFLPFLCGYGSHLLLDGLTPMGVYPLYPLKLRISGPVRTDSWAERLFFVIVLLAGVYLVYFLK